MSSCTWSRFSPSNLQDVIQSLIWRNNQRNKTLFEDERINIRPNTSDLFTATSALKCQVTEAAQVRAPPSNHGKKTPNNSMIKSDRFHLRLPSVEGTSYVLASAQNQVVSPGAVPGWLIALWPLVAFEKAKYAGRCCTHTCKWKLFGDGSSLILIKCSAPKQWQKYMWYVWRMLHSHRSPSNTKYQAECTFKKTGQWQSTLLV